MSSLDLFFQSVQQVSRKLSIISENKINQVLTVLSNHIEKNKTQILAANGQDLLRMPEDDPRYDRLKLTEDRLDGIAADLRNVANLPYPVGKVLEERTLENGLQLQKKRVPIGVIGVIYESRPNVTFDVFALCLKSGNACVLKGGSDAEYSNKCIVELIKSVLVREGLNANIIQLLPADRAATTALLHAVGYVDMVIPRGSQNLINYVRDNARVPVIETGAGIVHTYFDESGDLAKGADIVFNAKTRRVSVCNALDCLVIHRSRLEDLPELVGQLQSKNVTIYADDQALKALQDHYPPTLLNAAQKEHFGTEFLDYKMSIATVDNLDQAIDHISQYSSKHSEAIVSENADSVEQFLTQVDAATVYANASTAFTDGAQFGLGAEIGISTQKLHARGPMALEEMTSYKWVIKGNGTTRT